ncbi:related to 4-coumarate-CoA ligase [Melanopsichium pennsylvanicum]|uniref:Related to 4-coumarate-CoA ligase n=2 Tax=Melanopsichium pennsylvanicum TaxID=63383 RepID=A0AAJ4XIB6_9BASI|nr:related to 4-coumarate-CoA ligase [Melanopsichium pennsylvanicum 4]SNX82912.1 related to 4-coumarate-CoA ligase [Melanopsichium pennsylvanicum]
MFEAFRNSLYHLSDYLHAFVAHTIHPTSSTSFSASKRASTALAPVFLYGALFVASLKALGIFRAATKDYKRKYYIDNDKMIIKSPHAFTAPANYTLPEFLFKPIDIPACKERANAPLLYPADPEVTGRPDAKPLSLVDAREYATNLASALISGSTESGRKYGRGDVVGINAANQHDYLACALGIMMTGASVALFNPAYKPVEIAHQIRMVKATAIVTTEASYKTTQEAAQQSAMKGEDGLEHLTAVPEILVFEESHASSIAKILKVGRDELPETRALLDNVKLDPKTTTAVFCFSSGTTAGPKAVMLSHYAMVANVIQASYAMLDRTNDPLLDEGNWYAHGREHLCGYFTTRLAETWNTAADTINTVTDKLGGVHLAPRLSRGEFHLDLLPLFHCYGLLMGFMGLHTCTPRIVLPKFALDVFLRTVQNYRVSFCFVVPPILLALAKHPMVDQYDLRSLTKVSSGAASLPHELREAVRKRLNILSTDGYGMSEMSPLVCSQNNKDLDFYPGTVGQLVPGTEAKVIGLDGKEVGFDEEGELCLRGPQMMQGYLNNDEANSKTFIPSFEDPDRFLRTGDMVKVNKEGYVTITDRLKDVIKYNGFQVPPSELEALMFKEERVGDCAVLGVPDAEGTELPWAFVVLNPKTKEELGGDEDKKKQIEKELLIFVNERVNASYKKLRGLTWLDALPKSASGKILKKDIRAMVEQDKLTARK